VLLLHGHPRTHATWHRVAPLLARSHTVVCPDLRGYGESSKPPTTPDHRPYSKRAMAGDCLALMAALGHERFAVVGHDRGAYVALRTALDHPAAVTALAVLDAVPIGEALARCDARFAAAWWHWFFYGQTAKRAERVIAADPDAWYQAGPEPMGEEAYADYRRAIHDPATVQAMMEDYRAGSAWTAATTTRTGAPAAGSPARPWSCGPPATTCPTCTATSSASGALGRRPARPSLPLRPPHGRGGPRRPGRRAAGLPGRHRPRTGRLGQRAQARPGGRHASPAEHGPDGQG
jgi:haloacetate dehalogenase